MALRLAQSSHRTSPFWTVFFHGKPVTRAGNLAFTRGSKPVPRCDTVARAVENGLSVGERGLAATDGLDAMLGETVLRAPGFTLRGGTREILRGMIAKGMGLR